MRHKERRKTIRQEKLKGVIMLNQLKASMTKADIATQAFVKEMKTYHCQNGGTGNGECHHCEVCTVKDRHILAEPEDLSQGQQS